jgi:hypothetical protein
LKHAKANRERQRAAKGYRDRYRSLTYRLGRDMNLAGKTREEIAEATRNKTRSELVDLLYEHATFEPMFTPQEIATRRRISRKMVLQKIRAGEIRRAHMPLDNRIRVPLSAIREWDGETALAIERTPVCRGYRAAAKPAG